MAHALMKLDPSQLSRTTFRPMEETESTNFMPGTRLLTFVCFVY